jgi:predicted dienelactone hydrolase
MTTFRRTRRVALALTVVMALGIAAAACGPGGGGGTYGSAGRFPVRVTQESVTTFYYPSNMAAGTRYPVIIWGNGTITQPSWYDGLLRHWASHGFIVAAANTSNAGTGQEMLAGIDNLTAKNAQASSPFYQKVDLEHIGASGHSQGGAGTMRAAKDPRVKTAFPIEGPGSPQGIHGPVIFFAGQNDTALASASLSAYNSLGDMPGAYAELAGATHLTALGSAGGFRGGTTAWALWQLKGDTTARNQFVGASCGMCNNRTWSRYMANATLS